MRAIRERLRPLASRDEGLTLVEVVVAISLIAIVATASAALCISGIAAATTQERRQVAVTIANGTMEDINSRAAIEVAGVSPLYKGRYIQDVKDAFTAMAGKPGVANTYPVGDSTVTNLTKNPVIPITSTTSQSGTTYTITTLIGSCYQSTSLAAGGTLNNECARIIPQYPLAPPSAAVSGYSDLIRVIVVVSWTAGSQCSASGCSYTATSLIDPNVDLDWISHG